MKKGEPQLFFFNSHWRAFGGDNMSFKSIRAERSWGCTVVVDVYKFEEVNVILLSWQNWFKRYKLWYLLCTKLFCDLYRQLGMWRPAKQSNFYVIQKTNASYYVASKTLLNYLAIPLHVHSVKITPSKIPETP